MLESRSPHLLPNLEMAESANDFEPVGAVVCFVLVPISHHIQEVLLEQDQVTLQKILRVGLREEMKHETCTACIHFQNLELTEPIRGKGVTFGIQIALMMQEFTDL